MMDLIIEMFVTPGTPEGPYERMAAAMAHGMVGVLIAAALLRRLADRPWRAAGLACAIYASWELAQIIWSGSSFVDSAIDLMAVGCGALIAACLWARKLPAIIPLMVLLVVSGRLAPKRRGDGAER
ncbi:hypothetical protein [Paracoccus sp. ME4]|uniref:hypothetical protein n=1 Tax=Paracoccus sp. ME4 TaxID=3138066 RepID=UPI00398B582C